jgi:hypothetical protein
MKYYKASNLDRFFGTTKETENGYEIWNVKYWETVFGRFIETSSKRNGKSTI